MNTEFNYCRIGESLKTRLATLVSSGESAVLLGLRDIGKRYLLRKLSETMQAETSSAIVDVDFLREPRLTMPEEVRRRLSSAAGDASGAIHESASDSLLTPLDFLQKRTGQKPILIAANVDSLAHHQARRLLQEVQVRVKAGTLVALLTGEENLCELTHGLNSEFNCANHFIIQGFDSAEFGTCVERRIRLLNIRFEDETEFVSHLYELTGGNLHIARALIGLLVEFRARVTCTDPQKPVTIKELEQVGDDVNELGTFGANVFHRSVGMIDRNPSTWDALQALLQSGSIPVESPHPAALELAGVCVRETHGALALRVASPLMERFLHRHYDTRRWGDRYAALGQWPRAFAEYAELSPDARIRPADPDDRPEVLAAVKALGAQLHTEATKGDHDQQKLERLRLLLGHGCQNILGFGHVLFWQHRGKWELQPSENHSEAVCAAARIRLSELTLRPDSVSAPRVEVSRTEGVALLPALRDDKHEAVIIGDFEIGMAISKERAALLQELLDQFARAYSHAITGYRDHTRLAERDRHFRINQTILKGLGATVRNPRQVIETAAKELRALEYKRVLFCLVDPIEKTIKGCLDSSNDLSFIALARLTIYPLADPRRDIQPYVVATGRSFIVPDAANEPLVNKVAARKAGLHAFAVVPILESSGNCVGTIQIERTDGLVPSVIEVADLEEFGRQLAAILELSERVSMLQVTLDIVEDPVMLIDRRGDLRYANKPAELLFGFTTGWRGSNELEGFIKPAPSPTSLLSRIVKEALRSQHRVQKHVPDIGPERMDQVLADPVLDESGGFVGIALHLREISAIYSLLRALETFAEAKDTTPALHQLLPTVQTLGCAWARLYLVDPSDPDVIVSEKSLNFVDATGDFDARRVRVRRQSGPVDVPFNCLDREEPVIFRCMPESPEGPTYDEERKLPVIYANDPQIAELFGGKPGDYWLDLPILAGHQKVGKLSVECPPSIRDLGPIKLFVQMVNRLLTVRSAGEALEREDLLRQASEKAVAMAAHNIGNRLAPMEALLWFYRRFEPTVPPLKQHNDDLENISHGCLSMVTRIKELFGPIILKSAPCQLHPFLCECLRRSQVHGDVQGPDTLEV